MTGAERLDEFEQVSMREAPDTSSITRVSEVRPRTQYLGRAHTAEENEKKETTTFPLASRKPGGGQPFVMHR
jgi:hypothetical protein